VACHKFIDTVVQGHRQLMFKGSVSERGDDSRQIVFTNLSYASKEILMEGKSQQYLLCNNIHFGFSHL